MEPDKREYWDNFLNTLDRQVTVDEHFQMMADSFNGYLKKAKERLCPCCGWDKNPLPDT